MFIQLTRRQMTNLLYSLKGESKHSPSEIIEKAIGKAITNNKGQIPHFLFKKINKKGSKKEYGLSTNEIVGLANLCELTSLKSTSIQNWIKRDVKELIGAPELGKKYSIEQAAMLLIVRDLKTIFDFERIRNFLTVVFNTLSDRSDDLISPVSFYEMYAEVLEKIDSLPSLKLGNKKLEKHIVHIIRTQPKKIPQLSAAQWDLIEKVLVITVLSVLSSHLQTRAHTYLADIALFEHNE